MSPKTMLISIGLFVLAFLAIFIFIQPETDFFNSATPIPNSSPSSGITNPTEILSNENGEALYSHGSCITNRECIPAGCSNHICSNDPSLITTCEVPNINPVKEGYSCGCANRHCVWMR